jgi:transposase-like protein
VYQVVSQSESAEVQQYLAEHGHALLPLIEVIASGAQAVDALIAELGKVALEAVLQLSADEVAGPPHPGQPGGAIRRHGVQGGVVAVGGQKVRLAKPRLRRKGGGEGAEVPLPAYAAMQGEEGLSERVRTILLRGVSTRHYEEVVPEVAGRCGVSKSAVSREFQEASAEALRELCERRFEEVDLPIIYIDGKHFGGHQVICAVGVDQEGRKHVLGISEGATESAVVVKELLEDLVQRGVRPGRTRLFIIDGSKALRAGIDAVYGEENPVQRCRFHKRQNVLGYLPKELQGQVGAALSAAWKLPAEEGMARLRTQIEWLERSYPKAAASLREGLEETFTINSLGLSPRLRKCLATTNLIESVHSGVEGRTGRVTRWRNGEMALRWAASAALETERNFRKIIGHEDLWMLLAALNEDRLLSDKAQHSVDAERVAA